MLTEQERAAVDEVVKKIDITDTNLVLNYGVAAQKSVATFSENALSSVRNKDLGEVGETLSNLVVEVKGFGQEEKKGFAGLFHKQKDKRGGRFGRERQLRDGLLRRFGGVQGQLGHHVVAHIISPPYFGFEFVLFRAF